ncbi:hypothetical protein [Streptomyces europaeiscabiei]|uniref:hypothetical protein n=1 Tax=Streptomyces europaeiscabiei TaxID=146819 RepID=UPI0029B8BDE5|nr:hypothetical protein [Streptomyces europaeiscabiei]MDX2525203.1 hypothetical protein [Streptomyces europaeiscabiei]
MSDRLQVLTAVYQSDRADRSSALTVSLAALGTGVAYLIGTIAFYDKLGLLGWSISLLPLPLICVAAFQVQLVNLAAVRARSLLALERALLDAVEPVAGSTLDRTAIGVTASERTSNLHTALPAMKAAVLIAYGGVGIIFVAYTVLMLAKAVRYLDAWIVAPIAFYAALLVPIALAWRASITALDLTRAR